MAGFGFACLLLALVVCAYGIGASLYGVRSGRIEFSESGRRSVYALAVILTVAFVVLPKLLLNASGNAPAQCGINCSFSAASLAASLTESDSSDLAASCSHGTASSRPLWPSATAADQRTVELSSFNRA